MNTITIIIGGGDEVMPRTGLSGFVSGIEWGNAPAWAAVLAATMAATFAALGWRRERGRDRRSDQAALQAQAAQCAAWIDYHLNPPRLYIRNTSELPIENVNAWFWVKEGREAIPASGLSDQDFLPVARMIVAPGETFSDLLSAELVRERKIFRVSLTFTDAQGIFWARHDGKIVPNPFTVSEQPLWFKSVEGAPKAPLNASWALAATVAKTIAHLSSSRKSH